MHRSHWLLAAAVCAAAALPGAAAEKRNVVLIFADDHGRDLGCYGNRDVKTPNLDKFAADGPASSTPSARPPAAAPAARCC